MLLTEVPVDGSFTSGRKESVRCAHQFFALPGAPSRKLGLHAGHSVAVLATRVFLHPQRGCLLQGTVAAVHAAAPLEIVGLVTIGRTVVVVDGFRIAGGNVSSCDCIPYLQISIWPNARTRFPARELLLLTTARSPAHPMVSGSGPGPMSAR